MCFSARLSVSSPSSVSVRIDGGPVRGAAHPAREFAELETQEPVEDEQHCRCDRDAARAAKDEPEQEGPRGACEGSDRCAGECGERCGSERGKVANPFTRQHPPKPCKAEQHGSGSSASQAAAAPLAPRALTIGNRAATRIPI